MTWLAANVDLPEGKSLRYGPDEPGERTLIACTFDTQMPGGFGHASITIPRDPEVSAQETSRYLLAPTTIYGRAGEVAWDGRVADVGEVGADRVQLELEGWSAHLEDEKSFRCIYVHRLYAEWQGAGLQRQLAMVATQEVESPSTANDTSTPGVKLQINGTSGAMVTCEAWLDMGAGEWVKTVASDWYNPQLLNGATAVIYVSSDDLATATSQTADQATGTASGSVTFDPAVQYRYAVLFLSESGLADGIDRPFLWTGLYVVGGSHDVEVTSDGVLASDVVADVVTRAAPMLSVGDIQPSSYRIPHLVFDRVTPLAVIEKVSGLDGGDGLIPDWGVYEGREFFWGEVPTPKTWRVRAEINADPRDEGPTAVGRATHAIVSYTDANGRNLSIGPVGSGCDTESDELVDTDPENPYNRAGASASLPVDAGTVQDPNGAIAIGKLALREANADPRSGSIDVVGEVKDEDGHTWPSYMIRAGHNVIVENDADSPAPRRVGATSHNGEGKLTATISTPRSQHAVLMARLAAAAEGG
jgi:hypothetical protein